MILPLGGGALGDGGASGGSAAPVVIPPVVTDGGLTAAVWGPVVLVDGVDVTDSVVGKIVVEAEESAARIAEFHLHQPAGTVIDPALWVGKAVAISIADMRSGSPVDAGLLFSGIVDLPQVSPLSDMIYLRCTDDRQGILSAMSKSAIAALLPDSYWSPAVFDQGASSLVHCNDRVSTLPVAVDISPAGGVRVTPWRPKATPDIVYSADQVIDQSVAVDIAERSSLVNSVRIDFGYRFPLVKSEGYVVSYDPIALAATTFPLWVRDGNSFMSRDAIVAAIEQAGGAVVSITYTPLPTTPQVIPGIGGAPAGAWLPNPVTDPQFCLAFYAVVAFDYAQQAEEAHTITVANALSVSAIGTVSTAMSGALEGVYDDTVAAEQNILLYRQKVTTIPPKNLAPVVVGLTNSVTGTLTTDSDRAAANAAMEVLIAIAKTRIYSSHRAHSVSASVPCHAWIDIDKTVALTAAGVNARGKVRRVVHTLDADAGTAISAFDLAICSVAGIGATHAETTTAAPAGSSAGTSNTLSAPTVTWNGLAGQDQQITIAFPGVEETERAKALHTYASTFAAPLYEDLLTVTL